MRDHYRRLRDTGAALLTSNLVLAETATRLRYDAGLTYALAFRDLVAAAEAAGRLHIRRADAELEFLAWDVMAQYGDLALSFVDCIGAATAREASADAVFGLDNDFRILGFSLEP